MLGTYFYWFNMRKPGVNKLAVRKALTMAINRRLIVRHILKLGQKPLYGQVPPQIQGSAFLGLYRAMPSYHWVSLPLKKRYQLAKTMLQKAGYTKSKPLDIVISYNTSKGHQLIAEAVAEMWGKVFGPLVKVTLDNEEWKVYLQTLQKGNYQIGRMGGIATVNTAGNFLEGYLCHAQGNYGGYCNEKLDQAYQKSMHSPNQKIAVMYMKKALETAMRDYVTLPVYSYTYSRLVKKYVGGYTPKANYMDSMYSKWLYFRHL